MHDFVISNHCTICIPKRKETFYKINVQGHGDGIASSPGSTKLFNELDVEKREGLVRQVTCVTFRWKGGGRVIIVRGCFLY